MNTTKAKILYRMFVNNWHKNGLELTDWSLQAKGYTHRQIKSARLRIRLALTRYVESGGRVGIGTYHHKLD